jgi:hypothetical protein
MKEAELTIGLLRGDQEKNNSKIACTDHVQHPASYLVNYVGVV